MRGFTSREEQLAQRWFERGERHLAHGAAVQAVGEFQTALTYAPNNDEFRLKLALALMEAGRLDEARAHLVGLWETRPGDANINLQLARVMARLGNSAEAVRYYHGAIYGVWDKAPLENRKSTRFELANYLLSIHQIPAAQSDLIALAAEAPTDPRDQIRLGDLLMEAGEPDRALNAYLVARKTDGDEAAPNVGAARAAFALRRWTDTRKYAREALRIDPKLEEASRLDQQAEAILAADPSLGLTGRERADRAFAAFKTAKSRLHSCSAIETDSTLQQLVLTEQAKFGKLSQGRLRGDPDLVEQATRWVYDVERATEGRCGAPTGLDATLLYLARMQEAH